MARRQDQFEIEVIEGIDAVRLRPAMYLRSLGVDGIPSRLVLQALCHAVDEAVGGRCSWIAVELGADGTAAVAYDAGMPLCRASDGGMLAAEVLLSVLHACRAEKHHVKVGDMVCNLGLAVLNALCESLTVATVSEGWRCVLRYRKGKLVAPASLEATTGPDETAIELRLDAEILQGEVELSRELMQGESATWRESMPEIPLVAIVDSKIRAS
jgi:DNA gyrase/topoisomerase IV subunit B